MSGLKLHLLPIWRGPDRADGGIRRVLEAQEKWLPHYGVTLVDRMDAADVVATHALENPNVPVGLPWAVHNHGLYFADFGWEGAWYQHANKNMVALLRAADAVTAPSEWVAQVLRRGMWLRPTVLYHGVDPADWEPGENEGYVLWNKARADVASDPRPVMELAAASPSLRFVTTFGETAPNVRVTGALPFPQMRDVIRSAGVYLATARETFGIGTLEAMAAGVPVVGWAWGGQTEIIQHGVTGWLATPGDMDGLREGLAWAIAHRAEAGAAARADVLALWTWERAIARYADLYRQMAGKEAALRDAPRVSVIVPCYNLGRYLGETLASVQAQTLTDFECIIVDDASTDDSAQVAAEFTQSDNRFRYLRNEVNLHVSRTRNRGFQEARGRYLIPLDADDRMTPETLSLLSGALDRDRGIALAYGGLQIMTEDGRVAPQTHDWPPAFDFRQQIQGKNQVPTLCMMRREVVERTGGYRSRLSPVEDADLWTRAASLGLAPKKVTDAATLLYRVRPNSLSRTMANPDWTPWYPWARHRALLPFGAAAEPPPGQIAWPVPTYEPAPVAVIIPVGPGHEHLLIDALDSVEAQTFRAWECVVINDTGAPIPFVPPWAKVIDTSHAGSGPAAARNLGIAASTAPLLLFLDADDYLQADALEALVAVQREQGGVVYSDWYDDFGPGADPQRVYAAPDYDARLLTAKGCIHAVTALYPRDALAAVGGFDEHLSHWEDWDLQLALAAAGVCGTRIPRPLWTYRKAAGQRREQNAAAFEQGKRAILGKWGRYWEGKEELMACRSCPGGGGGRPAPRPSMPAMSGGAPTAGEAAQAAAEGLVLLEFMGPSPGTITYKGKATGAQYRFGNNSSAKTRYVHPADAPHLLALKGQFRRADAGSPAETTAPQLTAPGVPVRVQSNVQPEQARKTAPDVQSNVQAPMPQPEATAAVKAVADGLTYMEIRAAVPSWDREQVAVMLAKEKAGPARENVIKLLEAALPHAAEPAAASLA